MPDSGKYIISVGSEKVGFFITLGRVLSKARNVTFLAENAFVAHAICSQVDQHKVQVVVLPERRTYTVPREGVLEQALNIERKYSTRLSFLVSQDRAIGYGYLLNVEKYPYIKRANWTQLQKLSSLIKLFEFYENLFEKDDVFLSQWPDTIVSLVAEKNGAQHKHLSQVKFGNRYFWSDDNFQRSQRFCQLINNYLELSPGAAVDDLAYRYETDARGERVNRSVDYSISGAIKRTGYIIYRDTINGIVRRRKPNSYVLYGWAPSAFRKVINSRWVTKRSISPEQVDNFQLVYFPLHMEPEVALLQFSPEFSNTVEAICWVSKSLPANYKIIVKEQTNGYAVRSKQFYRRLLSLANVVLAHPDSESLEWVQRSQIVATMTGTVGQEAIHFKRPVISFGKHQIINQLPTVRFVTNYYQVKAAIDEFVSGDITEGDFVLSRHALSKAQIDVSFPLERYAVTKHANRAEGWDDEVLTAVKHLVKEFSSALTETESVEEGKT
jgi:hypothetical protein